MAPDLFGESKVGMTQRQFEGRSAAEAAIKACEVLGLTRSALRYQVISETGEQLMRRVVIEVDVDSVPVAQPAQPQASVAPAEQGSPARQGHFAASDDPEMPVRRNRVPERAPRTERGRRPGGRTSNRGPVQTRTPAPAPEAAQTERHENPAPRNHRRTPAAESEGRPNRGNRGQNRQRNAAPRGSANDENGIDALLSLDGTTHTVPPRPSLTPSAERTKRAITVLEELVRLMQMKLKTNLIAETDSEIQIDLTGVDEARIIGRKGEILLALQFVLNRMLSRDEIEGEQVVILDAGAYRERRRLALQSLAKKLASRALQERKAVRLSPMSAHDRRIFHMTLKEIEGVATRSEGDGLYRNLLIIPSEFA